MRLVLVQGISPPAAVPKSFPQGASYAPIDDRERPEAHARLL
jgi:hypothetical protein